MEHQGAFTSYPSGQYSPKEDPPSHNPRPIQQTSPSLEHPDYPELYNPPREVLELSREIFNLPKVRKLEIRPGKELAILGNRTHGINNFKATLAYQRGSVPKSPCQNCTPPKFKGPFVQCVVLEGFKDGACTNCANHGNASRCSLQFKYNDTQASDGPNTHSSEEGAAVEEEDEEVDYYEVGNPSPASASDILREWMPQRKAATDASHRLQRYTYQGKDALGECESHQPNLEGSRQSLPNLTPPVIKSKVYQSDGWRSQTKTPLKNESQNGGFPRGSMTARRGGRHSSSIGRVTLSESVDNLSKRKRVENPIIYDEDEPIAQRVRSTSTSPSDQSMDVKNTESLPQQNLKLADIPITNEGSFVMTTLSKWPPKRNVVWNVQNITPSFKWPFNVEAAMAYCVGIEAKEPCSRCLKGCGGFIGCIIIPGFFRGSCAGCQYNSEARKCSFYVRSTPQKKQLSERNAAAAKEKELGILPNITPLQRTDSQSVDQSAGNYFATKMVKRWPTTTSAQPEERRHNSYTSGLARPVDRSVPSTGGNKMLSRMDPSRMSNNQPPSQQPVRSPRYQKALNEAMEMTPEEQQFELADLKFHKSVFENFKTKTAAPSGTTRYKNYLAEAEEMSAEELELEIADMTFRITVMREAIGMSKK